MADRTEGRGNEARTGGGVNLSKPGDEAAPVDKSPRESRTGFWRDAIKLGSRAPGPCFPLSKSRVTRASKVDSASEEMA